MATAEALEPQVDEEPEAIAATADTETEEQAQKPARTVPLEELRAERKKRQELAAELERTRGENAAYQRQLQTPAAKTTEKEPDDAEVWAEGPAKYIAKRLHTVRQEAEFNATVKASRAYARRTYKDFAEKEAYFLANAPLSERNALVSEDDPCERVYHWAKSKLEPAKSADEMRAELKAEILAELKESGVEVPAADEKPKKPVPKTLAGDRPGGRESARTPPQTAVDMARAAQHKKF